MLPAVLGILSAVSGIASAASSASAANKAERAQQEALQLQKQQFDFMRQMTEEQKAFFMKELRGYEDIFGPIERTLSDYFTNMTPDAAIRAQTSELVKDFSTARNKVSQDLARRGLAGSGAAASSMTDLAVREAEAAAGIRSKAREDVMKAKMGWFNAGQGRRDRAVTGMNSAFAGGRDTARYLANQYGQQAAGYGRDAYNAGASAGSALGSAASGVFKALDMSNAFSGGAAPAGSMNPMGPRASGLDPYASAGSGLFYENNPLKKPWYAPK